jgi:putative inorganic carbon (HCO3(-)) transporter
VPTWQQWARSPLTPLVTASAFLAVAVGALSGLQPRLGLLAAFGVIFVALVLTDLQIGFLAMVMFAYLEVLSVVGGVSLAKVAGVLIVVAWLAVVSTRGRQQRNFFTERAGLTYLLLAFLGWSAISIAWSESSSTALESVMRYALVACLLPIAFTAVRDRRDAVHVLGAIVLGATVAAISAIVIPPAPGSADFGRATGTAGDANELAAALLVGLAIAVAFAVNRHFSPPLRVLAGVAAALCLTGILVSLSRGGLVGVAVALVIAVIVGGRWRRRVLALCGLLAALAVGYFALFASVPAQERVLNVSGGNGTGRLELWTVGLRMIEAHPLNGVGTGQFALSSVHYLLRPGLFETGAFILSTPKVTHNTYLNVVAELGIVGGALFIAILLVCIGCLLLAVKRVREAGDERMEILLRGLVVGIGGFLVTLMFLSEDNSKLLWILLALGPVLLAISSSSTGNGREEVVLPP